MNISMIYYYFGTNIFKVIFLSCSYYCILATFPRAQIIEPPNTNPSGG